MILLRWVFSIGVNAQLSVSRDKKLEIIRLLDDDNMEMAVEKLASLSESQIGELVLEAIMLEHIVKGKIELLKKDLLFSDYMPNSHSTCDKDSTEQ